MSETDSLLAKFQLLSLIPLDRRVGRKHIAVYAFILDWYHRKHGDALASVRHVVSELKTRDPFSKGLYTGDVHTALTDLVSWGYLTQDKGSGRRASRYVPVWNVFASVREIQNTTNQNSSVREIQNASVRESPNATAQSVQESQNEDPPTGTRLQETGTDRRIDCAEVLATGLSAVAAPAQDGFEELWRAYGYRSEKMAARTAYAKMKPDTELHNKIVASAHEWQGAWAAQGRSDAPRKKLRSWLAAEDWDCDPPTPFKAKEREPKVAQPKSLKSSSPVMVGEVSQFSSFGTYSAEIYEADLKPIDPFTDRLTLKMTLGDGTDTYHRFRVRSAELTENASGEAMWRSILKATGRNECTLDDVEDLLYRPFVVTIGAEGSDGLFISYHSDAANQNDCVEAAA